MRRFLWLPAITILFFLFLYSLSFAQSNTTTSLPMVASATVLRNANLRAGPGTNFAVVGTVKTGDSLDLVGVNAAGTWYELETGEWIAAFLVKLNDAGSATAPVTGTVAVAPVVTPSPQPTPAQAGQSIVPIGQELQGKGWRFKVSSIHKRKAVYFYDKSYVAMGNFLVVIIDAVNEQSGTDYFDRSIDPYLTDTAGKVYRQNFNATLYATWQYEGISTTYTDVNPGNFVRIAMAFDLPEDTGPVLLSTDLPAWVELGDFASMKQEDKK
jgi:hypothetical protein